ncbi:YceD family protein [Bdellovibrio sp. HCB337]|uniref:YceD family protein n=1 Tax=Bdellovibrio sp. HCB337 TaxID=3394358 RepID=UPI0039A679E0
MKINLTEIPEEGKSFVCTQKTGELNVVLKDLIGDNAFHSEFFIKPLNSKDFELSGFIKTELPEDCSRCGIDFCMKVTPKFKAILIPRQSDDRTGKYAKVNHVSESLEDGPEATEYDGMIFNMGEYVHEVVAINAPFNPAGPEDEKGDCSICGIHVRGENFGYNEEMPAEKPESPFAVLKNIKLN